jgi:hypothetical protein
MLGPSEIPSAMQRAAQLLQQRQLDAAESLYRQIIESNSDSADAHNDLGTVLMLKRATAAALEEFAAALRIEESHVRAQNNLGIALGRLARYDEAIAAHERAIQRQPDWPVPHVNLALLLLLKGDLARGFAEHRWRLNLQGFGNRPPMFPQPMWDGSPLNGRRIYIHSEQGFGDILQFVRYLPLVARQGGEVVFSCPPQLLRLLRQIPGVAQIATHGDPLPRFDLHSPLLSLPMLFKTTLDSIPSQVPYLSADPTPSQQWSERLNELPPGSKIGLCWAGSTAHGAGEERSLNPSALGPLRQIPNITFISLQKSPAPPLNMPIVDWTTELNDFADTAALIHNLDRIITVDSAVAHLAGAMGKPVDLLLPYIPDWRWLLDRPDSPWYPTMRLHRQPTPGDWHIPISKLVHNWLHPR